MIIRDAIATMTVKAKRAPAIVILGARQVGKTTLAQQFGETRPEGYLYIDFESPTDMAKLADAEAFFALHADKMVILDEVQHRPDIFNILRSVIDRNRRNGRFILLGSASPHLVNGVSESLAGRTSYLELTPITLTELPENYSLQQHWFRGGFPTALLAETNADFTDWADGYIRSYAERDLRMLFGYDLNTSIISRLWQMIAAAQSGLWNAESYSRALGVTAPVVNRYLDFMEGAFLVRKLQPWFTNVQKRLVKAPKVYVRDSGLTHALNRISDYDMLLGHPIAGGSWEGYVIEQIMAKAGDDIKPYFYRTHNGAEADLVLVKGNVPVCCIEIKLTNAPTISRGFHSSIADIGTDKNFIVTPGSDTYPGGKNITVCSLKYFMKNYLREL